MKEIFNQVFEKEKSATSVVQDAKIDATNILAQADADYKDLIKKEKEHLAEQYTEAIEAYQQELKGSEQKEKELLAQVAQKELAAKERVVQLCASEVYKVLLNGVNSK